MFTRAGFNARCERTGIKAKIYRVERSWCRAAELVRFASGDLAWYGEGRGFTWGGQVASFRPWVHINWSRTGLPVGGSWSLPSSPIEGAH